MCIFALVYLVAVLPDVILVQALYGTLLRLGASTNPEPDSDCDREPGPNPDPTESDSSTELNYSLQCTSHLFYT